MAIQFPCMQCGSALRVPDEHAGKKAQCPSCQSLNAIPTDPIGTSSPSTSNLATPLADDNPFAKPISQKPIPSPYSSPPAPQYHLAPHQGSMILTLGIAAIVCNFLFIPGILAWVMGRADLQKMKAGQMDRSGEGLTQTGMIMGIIMTCLPLVIIALYVMFILVLVIIGVASGAMQ